MLAALVATSVIAIVAAVFAIWPVVADAPWEDDAPAPVDRTAEIRCEGALRFRDTALQAYAEFTGFRTSDREALAVVVGDAKREIDLYC